MSSASLQFRFGVPVGSLAMSHGHLPTARFQSPTGLPGAGTTQAGVGETCGPYKLGQVTKSRGCKPGLQCVKGRCQQPAQ